MHVQVGEAAGKVHVEPFVPKQGVLIETDPKATNVNNATDMGDDEGAIEALIRRLQVGHTFACSYSACLRGAFLCAMNVCVMGQLLEHGHTAPQTPVARSRSGLS